MSSVKVEVRHIESKRWHNKTGQESFTRPKKIQALVDGSTMKYATGLTDQDKKDLVKKGVSYDLTDNYNSVTNVIVTVLPTKEIKLNCASSYLVIQLNPEGNQAYRAG